MLKKAGEKASDIADFCVFMNFVYDRMKEEEYDYPKCKECGGIGVRPVMCCNSYECACQAYPVDFVECFCGCKPPKWWR